MPSASRRAARDYDGHNTYHLWLRPGEERARAGRHPQVQRVARPDLSDSGGFQVYSLKSIRRLAEEGGGVQILSGRQQAPAHPEKSIQIQEALGVDIAMALDECPAAGLDYHEVARSLEMTGRWARRCLAARPARGDGALWNHAGGEYPDLRARAAAQLSEMDFDGMAIGG